MLVLLLILAPAALAEPEAPVAGPAPAPVDEDDGDIPEEAVRTFVPAPAHDAIPADYGVVFFGDAGSGTRAQALVARRIGEFCATSRCDDVVLLGDNFYPRGVASASDPLWTSRFVDIYGTLGLPFWPALGNHDYLGNPDAEVGWTVPAGTATTWNMPSRYFARDVGPARLIALDTNDLHGKQKRWIKQALAAPFGAFSPAPAPASPAPSSPAPASPAPAPALTPPWTIVYGHHPLWSGGAHGDTKELRSWAKWLDAADFYLCGHDHDQQVIARPGLVEVVMGSGGAGLRPTTAAAGSRFARQEFGFGYLALHGDTAEVVVVGIDGSVVGRFAFTHAAIAAGQPLPAATGAPAGG